MRKLQTISACVLLIVVGASKFALAGNYQPVLDGSNDLPIHFDPPVIVEPAPVPNYPPLIVPQFVPQIPATPAPIRLAVTGDDDGCIPDRGGKTGPTIPPYRPAGNDLLADSALDELTRTAGGEVHTGQTFDGSTHDQPRGTIDTFVPQA
jgi:hypothetical protein